jgi:periplasmic protein TonB
MAQLAPLAPMVTEAGPYVPSPTPEPTFHDWTAMWPSARRGRRLTAVASLTVHAVLLAGVLILPLLGDDVLPDPDRTLRAFFAAPEQLAPPPPPPPPPAAGPQRRVVPAAARPQVDPDRLVAPIEVPDRIAPEQSIDLGIEGGVPGGVEGGVPGGVVGGIVGGLPAEAPPPVAPVRIGGSLIAPKIIHQVKPDYPELARRARLSGLVILEATVDPQGRVTAVKVLRGQPLLDEPAVEAVRQWRYQPLLLNGIPTPFILTVTVSFNMATVAS